MQEEGQGKGEEGVRAEDRGECRGRREGQGKAEIGGLGLGGSSGRWLLILPMEWVVAARPVIRGKPPHLTDRRYRLRRICNTTHVNTRGQLATFLQPIGDTWKRAGRGREGGRKRT